MIRTTDIHSLSDFQRNAKTYIQHVTQSKYPIAITVNGAAEVVVLDAREYQEMVDQLERIHFADGIRAGEADIAAGNTIDGDEMFDELEKDLGISD